MSPGHFVAIWTRSEKPYVEIKAKKSIANEKSRLQKVVHRVDGAFSTIIKLMQLFAPHMVDTYF